MRFVSIAVDAEDGTIYALSDDGSVWMAHEPNIHTHAKWEQVTEKSPPHASRTPTGEPTNG